ncbi:DUF692 domain-containing protein [Parahaliea mediterranea]|uniref:DUF692 domain-containing protein n=1 Tax=Parahaliea mediterranea TaxID=651086 RepID=A0A939DD43_9GAMM|nr:DUF692 domain-containing protein [Parahaliea mediterranea]MBN7795865.1 DUF692 domain-containing protein [Parahaliea mediterranea]
MQEPQGQDTRDAGVGVGLRHPHYRDALERQAPIQFVEVHAENFYMDGGPALSVLHAARERFDVSIHATSLGLGAETRVPEPEIRRLARLVEAIDPILVSDHACFSWSGQGAALLHGGDLLPIAHNPRVLEQFSANVDRVQQALGRQLLVENLSAYLSCPDSTMSELEFLHRMCQRTGAGLLLDVNNVFVNAVNSGGADPLADVQGVIAGIDGDLVGEIHLAGSTPQADGDLLIDDHGAEVPEPVWRAYEHLLAALGPKPTLIEWDTNLPSWSTLVGQARLVRQRMGAYRG